LKLLWLEPTLDHQLLERKKKIYKQRLLFQSADWAPSALFR
jgi:hypothetical protein